MIFSQKNQKVFEFPIIFVLYSMYSKYSVKDLGISHSIPIKLRLNIDRNRKNQYGVVKKLTEILCERGGKKEQQKNLKNSQRSEENREREHMFSRKYNKQNSNRVSEMNRRAVSVKSKRVISQKYPNILRESKDSKEKTFTQFFDLFKTTSVQVYQDFTPYHLQQSYKGKQCQSSTRSISIQKRSARPFKGTSQPITPTQSSWRLSKWSTLQESLNSSFVGQNKL